MLQVKFEDEMKDIGLTTIGDFTYGEFFDFLRFDVNFFFVTLRRLLHLVDSEQRAIHQIVRFALRRYAQDVQPESASFGHGRFLGNHLSAASSR